MNLTKKLLTPLISKAITFQNRVVMAPMSRRRAIDATPGVSAPIYYGQRAGAGLIIAENSAVAPNGIGYLHAPGIYSDEQKNAWKKVVNEVHARKGKIFVQLVHSGRIGHPLNQGGTGLVAPSAVKAAGTVRTPGDLHLPMPQPEVLTTTGVQELINAHINAAISAVEIGFDGVEIHGAHGFLPEQFLNPYTNQRTDEYGGNMINRSRFLLEIMKGVADAIGKDRTGIRLSPFAGLNDLPLYAEEKSTHQYITDAMEQLGILYIHLSDQSTNGFPPIPEEHIRDVRNRFSNLVILSGGYTTDSGEAILQVGLADMIAYGRPFIANPDLVERFRQGAPLAIGDKNTFYEGGDKGYIDYPAMYEAQNTSCLTV